MEELDKIFENIKKENNDFELRVKNGDIYIPHKITLDKRLNTKQMLYLASYYCNNKDIKKTDELSQLNKYQLYSIKKKLFEYGYLNLKINNIENLKKETIKKSHIGKKCEWCGHECYILQEHHYPIPSKDGGNKVVNICPNCHYTFHKLESEIYE